MTTILLVRHGETDWNLEHRVQGHTDRPLNETGREQANALAELLADEPLDAIYSSDLARARQTAAAIAARHGLEVIELRELREKDFGTWEGLTGAEIQARFPDAKPGSWGDGESSDDVSERVLAVLERIAAAHVDGHIVVVTHSGPMRAALRGGAADVHAPIGNCTVVRCTLADGGLAAVV